MVQRYLLIDPTVLNGCGITSKLSGEHLLSSSLNRHTLDLLCFSGDPDHMVLWGQSAGGNAANSYGYANGEDPIVAGIVAQSGTTSQLNSPNTTAFTTLAAQFGCDGVDAEAELQCMQKADNDMLHDVIRNGENVPRFSPVADGVTLFENNTARLEEGKVAKVVCSLAIHVPSNELDVWI